MKQSVAIITLFNKAFRDKQNAWREINDNPACKNKSYKDKVESIKYSSKTFGGVFSTTEEAVKYCKRNPQGMDDAGYYDLLVIEEICLGGSIIPHKETWMRLKNNHHHYILAKKPGWSVGVCGYLG